MTQREGRKQRTVRRIGAGLPDGDRRNKANYATGKMKRAGVYATSHSLPVVPIVGIWPENRYEFNKKFPLVSLDASALTDQNERQ